MSAPVIHATRMALYVTGARTPENNVMNGQIACGAMISSFDPYFGALDAQLLRDGLAVKIRATCPECLKLLEQATLTGE